ncbi:signal peptidase II [Candidatus Bipolaricaulota bacterium]|nr:signal peptidase II [Candidatus Bipolaricaulota bacterium]
MDRIPYLSLTSALILLDRLAKWWAGHTLAYGRPQPLIGQAIRLTRVHNVGGAFGLFPGSGILFLAVSAIMSLVLIFLIATRRVHGVLSRIGVSIVLAGAIGNLIDRLMYGFVLDFFEIRGFPVFNLADACISVGAALIIIAVLFGGGRDRSEREADRL